MMSVLVMMVAGGFTMVVAVLAIALTEDAAGAPGATHADRGATPAHEHNSLARCVVASARCDAAPAVDAIVAVVPVVREARPSAPTTRESTAGAAGGWVGEVTGIRRRVVEAAAPTKIARHG